MNGEFCEDEISYKATSLDELEEASVTVIPKDGEGKCKYHCLYWYKKVLLLIVGYNCYFPSDQEDFDIVNPNFKFGSKISVHVPLRIKLLSPSKGRPWDFSLALDCALPDIGIGIKEAHVTVQSPSGCKSVFSLLDLEMFASIH